jgi:tetratricopeptide (TPR) repeat protein
MQTITGSSNSIRLFLVLVLLAAGLFAGCGDSPQHDKVREAVRASNDGEYKRAVGIYDQLIQEGTFKDDPYNRGVLYYNRALAWSDLGNYPKAVEDYTMAYKIRPDCQTCLHNRSVVYEKMGKIKAAMSDVKQMLKMDPYDSGAQERLKHLEAKLKAG